MRATRSSDVRAWVSGTRRDHNGREVAARDTLRERQLAAGVRRGGATNKIHRPKIGAVVGAHAYYISSRRRRSRDHLIGTTFNLANCARRLLTGRFYSARSRAIRFCIIRMKPRNDILAGLLSTEGKWGGNSFLAEISNVLFLSRVSSGYTLRNPLRRSPRSRERATKMKSLAINTRRGHLSKGSREARARARVEIHRVRR